MPGVGIGYAYFHEDKKHAFTVDKVIINDEIERLNQAFLALNQEEAKIEKLFRRSWN